MTRFRYPNYTRTVSVRHEMTPMRYAKVHIKDQKRNLFCTEYFLASHQGFSSRGIDFIPGIGFLNFLRNL